MVRRTGPIACPHASSQAPRVLTPELIGNQDRESGGRKRGSGDGKRKRVSDEGVSDKRVNKDGANEDGAKMERMKTWGSQRESKRGSEREQERKREREREETGGGKRQREGEREAVVKGERQREGEREAAAKGKRSSERGKDETGREIVFMRPTLLSEMLICFMKPHSTCNQCSI